LLTSTVLSRAQTGIEAIPVTVEVHISSGLPKFTIVVTEAAVKAVLPLCPLLFGYTEQ